MTGSEWVAIGILLVVGSVFLLPGVFIIRRERQRVGRIKARPLVEAAVESFKFFQDADTEWGVEVVYRYEVAQRHYRGQVELQRERVEQRLRQELMDRVQAAHPIGSEVLVHYDPDHPADGVAVAAIRTDWLTLVIGFATAGVGLVIELVAVMMLLIWSGGSS